MTLHTFRFLVGGLLTFGISAALAADGFANSCKDYTVEGVDLRASCLDDAKVYQPTDIALNNCLAASDGRLFYQGGGQYNSSCNDCHFTTGSYFQCLCESFTGQYIQTGIDLNYCIGTTNGKLTCENWS